MNYITVLIFFTSFFLEIFNSHAVLIKCYVDDISNFDETNNYVETEKFCDFDIPIDNINDGKINLNDLKKNIKNKDFLKNNYNPDISNNIENYIITNAYYYNYTQTILNFEDGNIIIPNYILNGLKNNSTSKRSIEISFISKESFEKLKSIKIANIHTVVEGKTRWVSENANIELKDLQEGFYKENWNYTIFNYVFHNFQEKIKEWESKLKMKFLNDGSDFKILQDGKEINILQCLQNNKCDNLTIELQFAYQFMFDVEYKSKNENYEIRDDFEKEIYEDENGNKYKKLKYSHENFGENCTYYEKLCIIIKKKENFEETIKRNFYSENDYKDLDFKINDIDIDSINLENLLGEKNKLTVICSEFSEYVKSYVIHVTFSVGNTVAGVQVSDYEICQELYKINGKMLAFEKKEDITAGNIKKKLKINNENAILNEISVPEYTTVNSDKKFDLDNFYDGMYISLKINKDYALKNNIIRSKKTNKVAQNNFNCQNKIFDLENSESIDKNHENSTKNNKNNSDKTITNLNSNNNISNLNGGPNCCCSCCANCYK